MSLENYSEAAEQNNSGCDKAGVSLHLGPETVTEMMVIVDVKTASREKPRHAGVGMWSTVVVGQQKYTDISAVIIFSFVAHF